MRREDNSFIHSWSSGMARFTNNPATLRFGLCVACAVSDGIIRIFSRGEDFSKEFQKQEIKAHLGGCNSLSWSPPTSPATLASGPAVRTATEK